MNVIFEKADQLTAKLRNLPEEDAPNPGFVWRSIDRVNNAQRGVLSAMDRLAIVLKEERDRWSLEEE